MAGLLDYGAGAASGLENYLNRLMQQEAQRQAQQRIDEEVRSNKAMEQYRAQNMAEQTAWRHMQQQSLDLQREAQRAKMAADEANQRRDDIRAGAGLRPIGGMVPYEDYANERKQGMIPEANYERSMKPYDEGSEDQGPIPQIKWLGTEAQQEARARIAKETGGQGPVHDTPGGLVRIGPNNEATPIMQNGKQAQGYHPPPQPITVQTVDAQGNPVTKIVPKTPGAEYAGKLPQNIQSRMYTAKGVMTHMGETLDMIDEADRRGLLGPIEGRWADFLAGKVGSTGNDADDELLGQLRMDLKLMTSGTVAAHFQSRGGQQMMHDFQALLDSGKFSRSQLRGALLGMQSWLGNYAKDPRQLETPKGQEAPADYVWDPKTRKLVKS